MKRIILYSILILIYISNTYALCNINKISNNTPCCNKTIETTKSQIIINKNSTKIEIYQKIYNYWYNTKEKFEKIKKEYLKNKSTLNKLLNYLIDTDIEKIKIINQLEKIIYNRSYEIKENDSFIQYLKNLRKEIKKSNDKINILKNKIIQQTNLINKKYVITSYYLLLNIYSKYSKDQKDIIQINNIYEQLKKIERNLDNDLNNLYLEVYSKQNKNYYYDFNSEEELYYQNNITSPNESINETYYVNYTEQQYYNEIYSPYSNYYYDLSVGGNPYIQHNVNPYNSYNLTKYQNKVDFKVDLNKIYLEIMKLSEKIKGELENG